MNKLDYIEFSDGTRHTFEEISNVLGIPISNVKCRYYASKARLEDCYYGRRKVNSRVKQNIIIMVSNYIQLSLEMR